MTFTIDIAPRSSFGTDKDEQFSDGKAFADEIANLDGVKEATCLERFQKGAGFDSAAIIIASISAAGPVVAVILKEFFRLCRKKIDQGKYETFSIHIHNTHFHFSKDTADLVEAEIVKMVEDALKKTDKK